MELGDPCGGIFELVNTFYLKEDAFKHLELPLEFCHHGGAWEPLLPTRLLGMNVKKVLYEKMVVPTVMYGLVMGYESK